MNKPIYLSHPLSNDTPLYGGARNINIEQNTCICNGDTANSLTLSFPNHAGTHVDVPYHFFTNGKKLTDYDASQWIFNKPKLIDVPCEDGYLVTYNDISEKINNDTDLLLIRTGYEKFRHKPKYWQKNPGLCVDLAKQLRLKHPNVRAIGMDIISLTSRLHREEGRKAHREFLGDHYPSSPIVLIEDMSLINYKDIITNVLIAPLIVNDADGAPCTVIAY